jgi:hypothetical protein
MKEGSPIDAHWRKRPIVLPSQARMDARASEGRTPNIGEKSHAATVGAISFI